MKVALITIHPAPYFDILIAELKKHFNIDAFYKFKKTTEKGWKQEFGNQPLIYSEYSINKRFNIYKKYDLVIFPWGTKENLLMAILLKLFTPTRIVFFMDHPIIGTTKTNAIATFIKRRFLNLAHFIFPASESCKNYLNKQYNINNKKMLVFPYAHSTAPENIAEINNQRLESINNDNKIRLLIANRFIERKGYHIIEKAFQILKEKDVLKHFDITMVGDGEELSDYKQKFLTIDNSIQFKGWVENNEYEDFLNNCDIYLHASLFEPFGIPPLDAMQRGKFVIVSDGVKSTDIFENPKNSGIKTYNSTSYNQLADILENIYKNRFSLYKLSKENITLVNNEYSFSINVKAINKALS